MPLIHVKPLWVLDLVYSSTMKPAGTVKDLSQICRCLGGAIGVIGLHPALLLFEQRYV